MKKVSVIMGISFLTNSLLSFLKILLGFIFKSGALIADGVHSFSDLVTDVVAIIGSIFSNKPADDKHPYGHGRLEYLTSFFIGLIILGLGFSVVASSFNKQIVVPSILVSVVCIFTIISKLFLALFLINRGKVLKNNILISSGKESSTDVLSSIVVLLSSILIQFSDKISFLKYADMVATIIVGIFIIRVGFLILKDNISILIGECETDEDTLNELKKAILDFENVKQIDKFELLKYGSYYKLIAEISINGDLSFYDAHSIIHDIENKIKKINNKIKYVIVHPNPYMEKD